MLEIRQRYKSKECHNKISGHSWTEITPIKKWDLCTECGVVGTYSSLEMAEAAFDEWDAYKKKFPFEIPRTEKEKRYEALMGAPIPRHPDNVVDT